jgi:hypothetical protein
MALLRQSVWTLRVLVVYCLRTGRWWMPLLLALLPLAVLLAATAKVAVPTTMYVLF